MNERNVVLSCKYGVLDVEWDDILAQIKRLVLSKDGDYCNVEAEYANSEVSRTQPTASNTGYKFADAHAALMFETNARSCKLNEKETDIFYIGFNAARRIA